MYLFDSLHMAANTMSASQLGIQVAGQNLAGVDVPGYAREQLVLNTGTSRQLGGGTVIGTGVQVSGVVQLIDRFLEERLRGSISDTTASMTQEKFYMDLEALLGEYTGSGLTTMIDEFFNSIDNVVNKPEDTSLRDMVVKNGLQLTQSINKLSYQIVDMQVDVNTQVENAATEINRLLDDIHSLNNRIALIEGGAGQNKEALGLRDQRLAAMTELAKLINVKTTEDENGQVTIYCGSDMLLSGGVKNKIIVNYTKDGSTDVTRATLYVERTGTKLDVRSGEVYGLYQGRDQILGGYAKQLNDFTYKLIGEFNRFYSSGQGLTGYRSLSSFERIEQPEQPLSLAGLDYPIISGGFNLVLEYGNTGTSREVYIPITVEESPARDPFSLKPAPIVGGTTLQSLADAISATGDVIAKVNTQGQLEISATSTNVQFSFSKDTSGVLAALGINTFFTGTIGPTIGINQTVVNDPGKFAASLGGIGHDVDNGVGLAAMVDTPNPNFGNQTVVQVYKSIINEISISGGTVKSIATSNEQYQASLQVQRDAVSGVNPDEETIMMMTYQRMYQASSKYISIINEMLTSLINI